MKDRQTAVWRTGIDEAIVSRHTALRVRRELSRVMDHVEDSHEWIMMHARSEVGRDLLPINSHYWLPTGEAPSAMVDPLLLFLVAAVPAASTLATPVPRPASPRDTFPVPAIRRFGRGARAELRRRSECGISTAGNRNSPPTR